MHTKGAESQPESNVDYDLFDPEKQTDAKLLSMKQWLFNAAKPFVSKDFFSSVTAGGLVMASFLHVFSLMLTAYFPDNYDEDRVLSTIYCFRVITSVRVLGSQVLYYFCVCGAFAVVLLLTGNALFSCIFHRTAHVASLLPALYWAGFLPVTELLVSVWQCNSAGQHYLITQVTCWSSFHVIVIAIDSVMMFFWVCIQVLAVIMLNYSQHYKHDPFSHYPWNFEGAYSVARVLFVINVRFWKSQPTQLILSIFLILYLCSLMWRTYPYYNSRVSFAFAAGTGCVAVGTVASVIHLLDFNDTVDFSSIAKFACICSLIMTFFLLWSQKRWYYQLLISKDLKTIVEMDAKIHILLNVMTEDATYIRSQEILLQTYSLEPSIEKKKEEEATAVEREKTVFSRVSDALQIFRGSVHEGSLLSLNNAVCTRAIGAKAVALELVKSYETDKLYYGNSVPFLYQMSGVYMYLVKNMHLAYATLLEAETLEPGVVMEFVIHMRKLELLGTINVQQAKHAKQFGYSKFEQVIQFESEYENLQQKMALHTNTRTEFWNTLRSNPSLNKLHSLGLEMIKQKHAVRNSWDKLRAIYALHIPLLRIYRSYHRKIIGDKEEAAALQRQIQYAVMEKANKMFSLGGMFSDKAATIIISSDSKIMRASKSAESIFLCDQKQLCGHYVSVLMPPLIGHRHQKLMETYYKTAVARANGGHFPTFGMDRDGYLIPLQLVKKQFYSLRMGMIYIGAIDTVPLTDDEQFIIMDSEGLVGGMTRQIAKRLKLSPTVVSDKKLNIKRLCVGPDTREIHTIEGEVVLRFHVNCADTLTFRSRHVIDASHAPSTESSRKNSNEAVQSTSGSDRQTGRADSLGVVAARKLPKLDKFRLTQFIAKCVITTTEYANGLIVKTIKVGKAVDSADTKRKRVVIEKQMIQYVATIFKAIRRFRALAARAKRCRLSSPHPAPRMPSSKVSCDVLLKLPTSRGSGRLKIVSSRAASPEDDKGGIAGDSPSAKKQSDTSRTATDLNESSKFLILHSSDKLLVKTKSIRQEKAAMENKEPDQHPEELTKEEKHPPSSCQEKTLKGISEIRKRHIDDFYPYAIKCHRTITLFFMLIVLAILGIRMGVSIWFNTKIVQFAPLMVENGERVSQVGNIGLSAEMLAQLYPSDYLGGLVPINTTVRENSFDYSAILAYKAADEIVAGYKDFSFIQIKHGITSLSSSQNSINKDASKQGSAFYAAVNSPEVQLHYTMNNKSFISTATMETSVQIYIATAQTMIDEMQKGTYSTDSYFADMIQKNGMSYFSVDLHATLEFIVAEASRQISLHESYSFGTLMAMIGVYALYFLVLIPFLIFTSRDLEAMLLLFLEIPRQAIHEEREKTLKFLKKLYREGRMKHKELEVDNEMLIVNNAAPEGEEGEAEDKGADEEELNKDRENSESEEEDRTEKEKRPGGKHKKGRRKKQYLRYESNVWKVLILFGLISCCGIAIYYALDALSKSSAKIAAFKIIELRHLSRNQYANTYYIPYLYTYILTNKTGVCGSSTCSDYLPQFFPFRLNELNTMLLIHKGNLSLLDDSYQQLYSNIMEGNPCTTTAMGQVINCSTLMGGVFASGAFEANIRLADTSMSVFEDFESTNGTVSDIIKFANDERLIQMEVLIQLLLTPALRLMMSYLKDTLSGELSTGILTTVLLMSVFVVVFVLSTVCWILWLMNFMRRTIFDTKSLLSDLPDDVILHNDAIYNYLTTASASIGYTS